jgi:hypothetical protein
MPFLEKTWNQEKGIKKQYCLKQHCLIIGGILSELQNNKTNYRGNSHD